jgi:hypothetical protein
VELELPRLLAMFYLSTFPHTGLFVAGSRSFVRSIDAHDGTGGHLDPP